MIELERTPRTPTPQTSLTHETVRVLLPLIILGGGALVLWGSTKLRAKPTVTPDVKRLPAVRTSMAERVTDGLTFVESGSVVPFRELTLAAEVAGRIVNKAEVCRSGRFVQAGTTLLTVDPQDYQLEVRRLQQEVRQAKNSIAEADVELANIRSLIKLADEDRGLQGKEVARLRSLVTGRAAAASELDRARSAEILARNTIQTLRNRAKLTETRQESLKAALELAQTKLEKAMLDLERTEIKAPCDGVITEEMVEKDSFVSRGMTLVKLEDTSAVEVRCNLRSDYLRWLWTATNRLNRKDDNAPPLGAQYEIPRVPATVTLDSGGQRFEWDGVLNRYEGFGLDSETRTVPCRILVDDPTAGRSMVDESAIVPALVRGMFVDVSIHVVPKRDLLSVPAQALRLGDIVWTVRDDRLLRHHVEVVSKRNDNVIIRATASLTHGDEIVVSPLASPHEGMEIEVESP